MGVSAGMKALMPILDAGAIPRPDTAIYVEPTMLDIYPAQMGFFIADIEVGPIPVISRPVARTTLSDARSSSLRRLKVVGSLPCRGAAGLA